MIALPTPCSSADQYNSVVSSIAGKENIWLIHIIIYIYKKNWIKMKQMLQIGHEYENITEET